MPKNDVTGGIDITETQYMIRLSLTEGLGARKQIELVRLFGSAEAIFEASYQDLRMVPFLTEQNVSRITARRDIGAVEEFTSGLDKFGAFYVSYFDSRYPALLREISDPPSGLYVLGELPADGPPWVSVIGSRRCSEYGLTVARQISRGLAQNGLTIISGMAKGIDAMAHRGALEGGGKTAAVLGCGVDICYPAENKALREQIIQNGCVLSEYPPGTKPAPGHFPARNRIISGLSRAVVVVEAAKRSGTLITVGEALDQGRDVLAVPGNITSRLSEGTNAMIKDGAGVALGYEDVLEFLGIEKKEASEEKKPPPSLTPEERIIYGALKDGPLTFDEITRKTNSQAQTVSYVLLTLELKGIIRKLPGLRYARE